MVATMICIAVVLLVLGFPLYLVFLISSLVGLLGFMDIPATLIAQSLFNSMNKTILLSVPFFILAGDVMGRGKMTSQLTNFFRLFLGRLPGGLGVVSVVSSAFFGAISGSSPAAVATIGKVMYPAMLKDKYSESFASGLLTSAGSLAIIIPPSINMILYSSVTNVSLGKLFIAGIIPGVILSILLSAYIIFTARKNVVKNNSSFTFGDFKETGLTSFFTLLMPVVVLGGIYLGLFTPTEAAIVSFFYATIVTFIISENFKMKDLWLSLTDAAKITSQILVIMAAASAFSLLLTIGQVPQQLASMIETLQLSPFVFLVIVNILFLIVGMFVDPASAIVALIPLLAPLVAAQGINMIHFGLITTLNLSIGMCTPPFGLNLFTAQAVFKVELTKIVRGMLPFLLIMVVVLLIVTYIPQISLWLPNLMD